VVTCSKSAARRFTPQLASSIAITDNTARNPTGQTPSVRPFSFTAFSSRNVAIFVRNSFIIVSLRVVDHFTKLSFPTASAWNSTPTPRQSQTEQTCKWPFFNRVARLNVIAMGMVTPLLLPKCSTTVHRHLGVGNLHLVRQFLEHEAVRLVTEEVVHRRPSKRRRKPAGSRSLAALPPARIEDRRAVHAQMVLGPKVIVAHIFQHGGRRVDGIRKPPAGNHQRLVPRPSILRLAWMTKSSASALDDGDGSSIPDEGITVAVLRRGFPAEHVGVNQDHLWMLSCSSSRNACIKPITKPAQPWPMSMQNMSCFKPRRLG